MTRLPVLKHKCLPLIVREIERVDTLPSGIEASQRHCQFKSVSDALSGDDRQPDYDLGRERPLLYLRGVLVPVETEQQNQMPPPSQNGHSRSRPGKKAGALRYIMRMRASPTTPEQQLLA